MATIVADADQDRALSKTARARRWARRFSPAASTSVCSRSTPPRSSCCCSTMPPTPRAGPDHPARGEGAPDLPLLACVRARARGWPGLRVPRAWTARAGTRAPVRRREGPSRSIRPRHRGSRQLRPRACDPAGRQRRGRDEERRRRSAAATTGKAISRSGGRSPKRSSTNCTCAASRGIRARASGRRRAGPTPD